MVVRDDVGPGSECYGVDGAVSSGPGPADSDFSEFPGFCDISLVSAASSEDSESRVSPSFASFWSSESVASVAAPTRSSRPGRGSRGPHQVHRSTDPHDDRRPHVQPKPGHGVDRVDSQGFDPGPTDCVEQHVQGEDAPRGPS